MGTPEQSNAPYPDMTGFWICPDGKVIKLPEFYRSNHDSFHLVYVMNNMRVFGLDEQYYIDDFMKEFNYWYCYGINPENMRDILKYFKLKGDTPENSKTGEKIMRKVLENGFIRMRKYLQGINNIWAIGFIGSIDHVKSLLVNMAKSDHRLMADRYTSDFILSEVSHYNPWARTGNSFKLDDILRGEEGKNISANEMKSLMKAQDELHTKAGTKESDVLKKQRGTGVSSADRVRKFGDIRVRQLASTSESINGYQRGLHMRKTDKFISFLESLKTVRNANLIESVKMGLALLEAVDVDSLVQELEVASKTLEPYWSSSYGWCPVKTESGRYLTDNSWGSVKEELEKGLGRKLTEAEVSILSLSIDYGPTGILRDGLAPKISLELWPEGNHSGKSKSPMNVFTVARDVMESLRPEADDYDFQVNRMKEEDQDIGNQNDP